MRGESPVFLLPQERRRSPVRGEHSVLWILPGVKMLSAWALKVLTAPWSHSTGFELASRISPFPPPWLRLSENLVASDHPLHGTSYVTLVLSTARFAPQNNSHGAKPMDMSLTYEKRKASLTFSLTRLCTHSHMHSLTHALTHSCTYN